MVIAVTGHRPDKLGNEWEHKGPITDHLRHHLKTILDVFKPTSLISGGSLGFDTIAAQLALEEGIKLTLAIPFDGQYAKWNKEAKEVYRQLLIKAEEVHIVCSDNELRAKGMGHCYFKRNMWMVDRCRLLVAAYDGTPGGTHNTVKYARSISRPIQLISPS